MGRSPHSIFIAPVESTPLFNGTNCRVNLLSTVWKHHPMAYGLREDEKVGTLVERDRILEKSQEREIHPEFCGSRVLDTEGR